MLDAQLGCRCGGRPQEPRGLGHSWRTVAPPAALYFLSKGGEEFPKLHVPPATVSFPSVWRQVNMDLKQGRKTGKPRDSWRKKCFSFPGGLVCISCWLRHKNFSITSKTTVRVAYIEATFSFLRQISDKAS